LTISIRNPKASVAEKEPPVNALLHLALSNALLATVLALLAAAAGRIWRRPAPVHSLWLLVLLKLITPSLIEFPIPWPDFAARPLDSAATQNEPEPSGRASGGEYKPEAPAKDVPQSSLALQAWVPNSAAVPAIASESPESRSAHSSADSSTPAVAADSQTSDAIFAQVASIPWLPMLAGIWLVGSAAWSSLIAYRISRFHRLLRCARPVSDRLREQAQELAKRLGLAACPDLLFAPGRISPMVWALGRRPRLFLPSALWERLNAEQQAALLVHEFAHLRRRDQWVRGLELIVTIVYWWHPVVWWACREIREAEEQCCDAWVVWSLPRAARAYATALLATIDFLSETDYALPAVASGIGHVHDLRRRLTMIMQGKTPRGLSGPGLAVVLGMGVMLLPLMPKWAEGQPPEPRPRPEPRPVEEQRRFAEDPFGPVEEDQGQADRAERAGRELSAARREARELKGEVDRLRQDLERATKRLEAAQRRLASLQQNAEKEFGRPERAVPPTPQPLPPTRRRERTRESEQRLSELERRLDTLLREVRILRREIRNSRPGMGGLPPGTILGPVPANSNPGIGPATTLGPVPIPRGLPGTPPEPPAATVAPVAPAGPTPPAATVAPANRRGYPRPGSAAPAATPPESPGLR
jgi:bla regulator protein BlaR1